jgi:hypothetical protein
MRKGCCTHIRRKVVVWDDAVTASTICSFIEVLVLRSNSFFTGQEKKTGPYGAGNIELKVSSSCSVEM